MSDLISILMPLYNAERYVGAAIDSCIGQVHTQWELLVVDDASTDSSVSVVESFDDPRVCLHRLPTRAGPGSARNVALRMARGGWITVLDADDLYHRQRLATLLAVARDLGRNNIYFDQVRRWEDEGSPPRELCEGSVPHERHRRMAVHEWFASGRTGQPFFYAPAVHGVWYPDTHAAEDTFFVVRLAQMLGLDIVEVTSPTYIHRMTPGSLSTKTPCWLKERERAYRIMVEEFPHQPLAGPIWKALRATRMDWRVMELRSALSERHLVEATEMVLAEPRILCELARRVTRRLRANAARPLRKRRQVRKPPAPR